MSPRIHVLPEILVNQIAAGEVVERPASVVKELVENSLDAGATVIKVDIRAGGRSLIRVVDNGCGMTREDALLSIERHATSKIHTPEDLFAIGTLGFRGEAMAAIGSVSRLEVVTRTAEAEAGLRLMVTGGKLGPLAQVGAPVGTAIEVRDLFFNTPARLKFLKSATLETSHIIDVMTRTAMAQEGVAFALTRGEETLIRASQGSRGRDRIFELLGKRVGQHLHPFSGAKLNMRLTGLVSSPELSRSSWTGFYLFVNGRPIRDRRVMRAVAAAYQGLLPRGRYPVVVLRLILPAEEVDVNVHPGKLEARFAQSRALADLVVSALKSVLDRRPWSNQPVTPRPAQTPRVQAPARPYGGGEGERAAEPGQRWVLKRGGGYIADGPLLAYGRGHPNAPGAPYRGEGEGPWEGDDDPEGEGDEADREGDHGGDPAGGGAGERRPRPEPRGDARPRGAQEEPTPRPVATPKGDALGRADPLEEAPQWRADPDRRPDPPGDTDPDDGRRFSRMRVIGQYLGRYLICQEGDLLVFIDRQVAQGLILAQALKGASAERSQPLLIPRVVEVEPAQVAPLKALVPTLRALGLELEPFGEPAFALKALPTALAEKDPERLLRAIATGARGIGDKGEEGARQLLAEAGARDLSGSLRPSEYPALMAQLDAALKVCGGDPPGPLLVDLSRSGVARLFDERWKR